MSDHKTHFGFSTVDENEKAGKVAEVFHSVAKNYDIMNDVMSGGLHRVWKHFTINTARLKKGDKVLDIAGGTGDLSRGWAKRVGKEGEVWLTDINSSMLTVGRDRLINEGLILPVSLADAEKLPFPDNYFNLVSVAFGLRNMTHKDAALKEMYRVLKPGGTLLVLEFSKVYKPLEGVYDLCERRRQLSISGRIHPYAPGPGNFETDDAGRGFRQRGLSQHERGHCGVTQRSEVLITRTFERPSENIFQTAC